MSIEIGQTWVSNKRRKYQVIMKVQHTETKICYWRLKSENKITHSTLEGQLLGPVDERLVACLIYKRPNLRPVMRIVDPEEQKRIKLEEIKKNNENIIRYLGLSKGRKK